MGQNTIAAASAEVCAATSAHAKPDGAWLELEQHLEGPPKTVSLLSTIVQASC
jgi:hypothetical protein